MPAERLPARLTPLAAGLGLTPFYGDLHNHCAISYGHGSLDQALKRARQQLDFVSITGHAYWPDMPVDDPRVAHIVDFHVKGFARLGRLWPAHFDTLAEANAPGAFTVFPGYEIHSCAHGDYTIVYRDLDPHPIVKADTPDDLQRLLRAEAGDGVFAFPHHIGYRLGARGINWASFREDLSPVLEIVSMHGCSETSLTDRPFLHSMGPSDGHSTARHGLGLGHRFGFLGNTDHHSGHPGSYGHGRSAVYAPENDRAALWDALHQRRTAALTGDNAHLFFTLGGAPMGATVPPGTEPDLRIEAVAGGHIDYIDVIRNSDVVARVTPDISPSPIDTSGDGIETVFMLEMGWGSRGQSHDWRGTLSVVDGEILALEPRLRGAEVVSPLEAEDDGGEENSVTRDGNAVSFAITAWSNPNNMTPATQAVAARVRIGQDTRFVLEIEGQTFEASAARLTDGAFCGNLGPIDSPAFRFHPLPKPHQWQWQGAMRIDPLRAGDWVYVRMRQANGQWAWASPVFCRAD
ncbi:MAG: hypothetical protein KDJ77_15810 [Rhodobiaceae bacterium]|nr:hypothetical protein [Rhodobiaceae bacterium]